MVEIFGYAGIGSLILAQVPELTVNALHTMTEKGEAEYGGYTASLFKNATKTEHLAKMTIEALA